MYLWWSSCTHMPGKSYHRWLRYISRGCTFGGVHVPWTLYMHARSIILGLCCVCDIFEALISSLVCWFYKFTTCSCTVSQDKDTGKFGLGCTSLAGLFHIDYFQPNQKICSTHCLRQFFIQCHGSGNLWIFRYYRSPAIRLVIVSSVI